MVNRKYIRVIFNREVGRKEFCAEIVDGNVMGWQPLSLDELNEDITTCMKYIEFIGLAREETTKQANHPKDDIERHP